jgi:hypothetical protein
MKDVGQRALVCGFGDVAAGVAGLAWDLGEPGALLLSEGEARLATFAIEEGGDAATLELSAGETTVEAILTPRTAAIPLASANGASAGIPTVTGCTAEVRSAGAAQTLLCAGQIARWSSDPLEGAGIFRHLTIDDGPDTLLIATALGTPGADGHGEERTSGWLLNGENATRFEEALISTQYDGAGEPTRIGLELWPEDADQTSRAGARRVTGSLLGGAEAGGTWAGIFGCHTDGTAGLGSYLLWRA